MVSSRQASPRRDDSHGPLQNDGVVHHPLGSGSYMWDRSLVPYIHRMLDDADADSSLPVSVHFGVQPNNSPHVGTQVCIMLGWRLAESLGRECQGRKVNVVLDLVDTAPSPFEKDAEGGSTVPEGYQRSLRDSNRAGGNGSKHLPAYKNIMEELAALTGDTPGEVKTQTDLNRNINTPRIVQAIVQNRDLLGPLLCPKRGRICLRAACPVADCGLADKHAAFNDYSIPNLVSFRCPVHGNHFVDLTSPDEVARLEFNTPLRNLVRNFVFALDTTALHIRVTGSDYAGSYQLISDRAFHLLAPHVQPSATPANKVLLPPFTLFAPLIVDWAGSKLSKSLYVETGAYEYLVQAGHDWLLSLDRMREVGKDPKILYDEVGRWLADPKQLFRPYSIEYILQVYRNAETAAEDGASSGAVGESVASDAVKAGDAKPSHCIVA